MIFKTFDNSNKNINDINNFVKQGKKVFILIFMHGCGPCNATRPEWNKIKDELENKYKNNDNIVVVDVNKDYLHNIENIGDIDGFPTIKYISNYGKEVESYENSTIKNKDRSVDSFIDWIETKILQKGGVKKKSKSKSKSVYTVLKRLSKKNKSKSKRSKKTYKKK
jgi:thiol-disulfide isomerase/thioredoxin